MGGHLFRKPALGAILLAIAAVAATAQALPSRNLRFPTETPVAAERALPSAQSHAGPALFPLGVDIHPRVQAYLDRYRSASGQAELQAILRSAEPYRDFIARTIEALGAPPEFLYLPAVESGFRNNAVSRSGAAGLWQFMTNSIGPYDMRVNEWMDERRDFWKSTEGAIRKLQENYAALGDWLLALGAYNCGLTRMRDVVRSSGIRDFWQLCDRGLLPSETAAYVPKFLAVASLCLYQGRNRFALDWETPVRWERVAVRFPVDLDLLARQTGVPISLLLIGNAELNHTLTPAGGLPYFLKVPSEHAEAVRAAIESDPSRLVDFELCTVESGDTLYAFSRFYGVPVDTILLYNAGVVPNTLRVGRTLVIPDVYGRGPYARPPVAAVPDRTAPANEMVAGAPDAIPAVTPAAGIPSAAAEIILGPLSHVVERGETLWSISRRYGVALETLAQANALTVGGVLEVGTVLRIPVSAGTETEASMSAQRTNVSAMTDTNAIPAPPSPGATLPGGAGAGADGEQRVTANTAGSNP